MAEGVPVGAPSPPALLDAGAVANSTSSFWSRLSDWVSEHKAVVYTVAGVTLVVTGAGAVYYFSGSSSSADSATADKKKARKDRKKGKKDVEKGEATPEAKAAPQPAAVTVEPEEELSEITAETVANLSESQKKDYAAKLKAAGNKAYGSKDYNKAIDLYGQALLCKADPVFYSNRAACWNAMSNWDKVIEDTTAALNLDAEYVKALNRRANAYEQSGKYSEALLDYTASCIIDSFRNDSSAQAVERLLKKVAEAKAATILASKTKKLPSPTFVSNYLQSFRPKPVPEDLQSSEISDDSGKGQLRKGLLGIQKRTGEGYNEASDAFEKAIEVGDLGEYEALAYNMRGTFRYLKGATGQLEDLNKSIDLDKTLVQSYVKRASMHLEMSDREEAKRDFEKAIEQDDKDPDIYYHRAQLNFILSEYGEAAKDYQKSIDLDPKFIFSHIQLGVTQYKMGSIASSMATFRRCMKNFDKVPDVYNYYGELLLDQQKFQEAIDKFDTAVELEKKEHVAGMNVLPLINKALALFQWKQDFQAAEDLCQKALIIDPECDIAVATMAQLLLQQGRVVDALKYFEKAAELSRTEGEIVNALSYAEATRTQLEVQEKYPQLASRLQGAGMGGGPLAG